MTPTLKTILDEELRLFLRLNLIIRKRYAWLEGVEFYLASVLIEEKLKKREAKQE